MITRQRRAALLIACMFSMSLGHTNSLRADDAEESGSTSRVEVDGNIGPNGGRMIDVLEPALEFRVKPNRHIELRAFRADGEPLAMGEQWIQLHCRHAELHFGLIEPVPAG